MQPAGCQTLTQLALSTLQVCVETLQVWVLTLLQVWLVVLQVCAVPALQVCATGAARRLRADAGLRSARRCTPGGEAVAGLRRGAGASGGRRGGAGAGS